jgi:hypothetical protein
MEYFLMILNMEKENKSIMIKHIILEIGNKIKNKVMD